MSEEEKKHKKPLVTVQHERETDLATGEIQTRMFVKMYFDAVGSGLLAALGDRHWRTLCALATFMDEDGYCYPSQATVAKALGVSRQMANERIRALSVFRFEGKPVLQIKKGRRSAGKWIGNVYQILPVSQLAFGKKPNEIGPDAMSRNLDMVTMSSTMSSSPDTVLLDTNKNHLKQERTRTTHRDRVSTPVKEKETSTGYKLVQEFHRRLGRAETRTPKPKELMHVQYLLETHGALKTQQIITFAIREAGSTNFTPEHFGAVMNYVDEALGHLERQEQAVQREAKKEQERQAEYDAAQKSLEEFEALPIEDRVQYRLERWLEGRQALKRPPTGEQTAAKRGELFETETQRDVKRQKRA